MVIDTLPLVVPPSIRGSVLYHHSSHFTHAAPARTPFFYKKDREMSDGFEFKDEGEEVGIVRKDRGDAVAITDACLHECAGHYQHAN